ncbi:EI24 domain-containing protein [Caminibacter mediatlanticus]|uniref:EI24 domain-containing protein n=1 Tax=Caminibacter mediatlanticus TB-2 TaxID=391592 RepID=A0AAI9F2T8_9BACT|nr:EI24 domain-containing protein [Caminibacter mediatlanticus]EDM23931.1 hypothetical protein CMTB2_06746 [Caminibacter mediatlanticus TB-2]
MNVNVTTCIIKGIKDLFNKDVLKAILLISLPIFILYILILGIFWDKIIIVNDILISWIPFSVLKLNGAFFILFFLWFLAVVVTYGFISIIFFPLLNKFEEKTIYYYSIFLLIIIAIFYSVVFISNWDNIYLEVKKLLTLLPFTTISKGVGALVTIYIFYNLFILTLYLSIFFIKREFIEAIKELEYGEIEIKENNDTFKYKKIFIKDILTFLILFILLFPLFFIPVINIAVQLFLWSKLYHDSFLYLLCNKYCDKKDFENLKNHQFKTILVSIIAASFNFIPIISFFAPFFALIMFFHCIMQLKSQTIS